LFFGYLIQLLIVLFLYLGYPLPQQPPPTPWFSPVGTAAGLVLYGWLARRLLDRAAGLRSLNLIESRLSWLAVLLFGLSVYLLDLPLLILELPLTGRLTFLNGLLGLSVYYLFLSLLWSAVARAMRRLSDPGLKTGTHILGQLRWTLPLLAPWFLMALIYDLIDLFSPRWLARFLATSPGDMGLVAAILVGLALLMPPLVTRAWGCRPLPPGELRTEALALFDRLGVRVRDILSWPLMGGRLLTAGVMGLIPRLRYLLLTPGLVKTASREELMAVLAHEAGHIKHRHLLLYLVFFLGYMVLAYTLGGLVVTGLLSFPRTAEWLLDSLGRSAGWFTALISAPMLVLLLVYFRVIFAFFMRNFERQADAFAAGVVGPGPVIQALERIAFHSGISRRTPSWHHFSIAQRVEFLRRSAADPGLIGRHRRTLRRAFGAYLAGLALVAALALPSGLVQGPEELNLELVLASLDRAGLEHPLDPKLHLARGMVLTQLDRPGEAARAYEAVLELAPGEPTALNDLAWLLVTGPESLRDPPRALRLASKAAAIRPEAAILDTLAEAYLANGRPKEALIWSRRALEAAGEERSFFRSRLERFEKAASPAG